MDDVEELGSVAVRRQVEAILLDGDSEYGAAGALELVVVVVPRLDHAGFRLDAVVGFAGVEPVELALVLPLRASVTRPSERAVEKEEQSEGNREKQRISHFAFFFLCAALLCFAVKWRAEGVGIYSSSSK